LLGIDKSILEVERLLCLLAAPPSSSAALDNDLFLFLLIKSLEEEALSPSNPISPRRPENSSGSTD